MDDSMWLRGEEEVVELPRQGFTFVEKLGQGPAGEVWVSTLYLVEKI